MDIAVIDSYSAGINIYGQIQQLTKMGVYLDDYNRLPYPAGIVINGSPNAGNLPYPSSARTTYLLGSEFQPLRKPFWSLKTKRHHPVVKSLFLACGGSDPQQLTPMLIQFLTRHYPEIKIIALVGKSFQNPEKMQHLTGARVHILVDPPVEQLIEAMQGSDVAVTAAGQTINELAAVGLPPIVIGVVENQKNNIDGWLTTNFIEFAGWWNDRHLLPALKQSIDKLIADSALRQKKSRIGQRLIDGQGSRRIIMKVLAYVRNH
jgi:spore coat polysaccharide biosynthesis predicted glycosyltransferase SpsG